MNNDIWTAIASVFTGKGGTIKLTIFGSLIAATIYEILDAHYNFSFSNKDTTVSLSPTGNVSQALQPESREDIPWQETANDGITTEPKQA